MLLLKTFETGHETLLVCLEQRALRILFQGCDRGGFHQSFLLVPQTIAACQFHNELKIFLHFLESGKKKFPFYFLVELYQHTTERVK